MLHDVLREWRIRNQLDTADLWKAYRWISGRVAPGEMT